MSARSSGDVFGASGTSTHRGTLILGGDPAELSRALQTEGMPRIFLWINQTAPVVVGQGATISLEFTVRAANLTVQANAEWLRLTQDIVLVPGQPVVLFPGLTFPASKVRLRATRVAGIATTIDFVLGCASLTG